MVGSAQDLVDSAGDGDHTYLAKMSSGSIYLRLPQAFLGDECRVSRPRRGTLGICTLGAASSPTSLF
jgi:hypothetical protein